MATKNEKRKPKPRPARRVPTDPDGLSLLERTFVLAFQANGGNATRAYRAASPTVTQSTAAAEGYKTLRKPHVREVLDRERAERFKRYAIDGDRAIELISLSATADIADAYDDNGKLLPVEQWPESLRLAVKGIKANGEIILHDALKARELMAMATGRLRASVDLLHKFDHEGYVAGLDTPPKEGR